MKEIAKTLKNRKAFAAKTDQSRHARIDELCVHQERNPTAVSQLLAQIRDLQNKVKSLSAALERPTFPVIPILSPRTLPRTLYCRVIH